MMHPSTKRGRMTAPLPQRIVAFHGDELIAVQQPDGTIFVLLAKVCDNLGLARWPQTRRIQSHAVLNEGLATLPVETAGGPQTVLCLRLNLLPLCPAGV